MSERYHTGGYGESGRYDTAPNGCEWCHADEALSERGLCAECEYEDALWQSIFPEGTA